MGRRKISIELVQKEKLRNITFQTRKSSLMKKVSELSILCDIDVCVILYAPNFEGEGFVEPETWPKDTEKVARILQKYYNTSIDKRPKIYDVQEYFKGKKKNVEIEISKVRREKQKIFYQTWNEDFNSFGVEQLRLFARVLDSKLHACNQKMNMLKGDLKGKAIPESHEVDEPNTPYFTSNPSSYFNLVQNNMSQAQIYPQFDNFSDQNPNGFWPLHLGQTSQPSPMLSDAQTPYRAESEEFNGSDQVDANVTYDPKIGMMKNNEAENDENLLAYYCNGTAPTIQSYEYPISMQSLPFQNLPNLPHGFQLEELSDMNNLQAHMFNYMDGI